MFISFKEIITWLLQNNTHHKNYLYRQIVTFEFDDLSLSGCDAVSLGQKAANVSKNTRYPRAEN